MFVIFCDVLQNFGKMSRFLRALLVPLSRKKISCKCFFFCYRSTIS